MALTSDPKDPRLSHGEDKGPVPQAEAYLVLSDEALDKEYKRPIRQSYVHLVCGTVTRMALKLAQTYAVEPKFYSHTYCVSCRKHLPVEEFVWDGTNEKVGS